MFNKFITALQYTPLLSVSLFQVNNCMGTPSYRNEN